MGGGGDHDAASAPKGGLLEGRHVFYVLCTLPVSAGESLVLTEEGNRALRREIRSGESGEHAIICASPAVLPTDEFALGWQVGGEARVLKLVMGTHLAMRTFRRWLLQGRFDHIVRKGSVRAKFTALGLGTEWMSGGERRAASQVPRPKRAGFGFSPKQWAMLEEEERAQDAGDAVSQRVEERRGF
eukprot:CAMPEP_0174936936 /NCGR_PEP_ID=MMETSP1355-20121228/59025_1 /TAXON_ID=464990 /ORGANISM="Hemiselmis tepida, Strain CCMP443" /LENGTH=185 /DNA_ID=CAMNT_0016183755 /DNA_START=14 /DNA_END=568 /DNA_ORIENTATION=+